MIEIIKIKVEKDNREDEDFVQRCKVIGGQTLSRLTGIKIPTHHRRGAL